MASPLIIFDDGHGRFGPMTDLRSAFEVRTGMLTTGARISMTLGAPVAGYWVDETMAAMVAERVDAPVNVLPGGSSLLVVNGRWGLPESNVGLKVGHATVEASTGHVIAARLPWADADEFLRANALPAGVATHPVEGRVLATYPWDVLRQLGDALRHDTSIVRILDARVPANEANIVGRHPINLHSSARVFPNVVFDAEQGAISVHDEVVIRPGAVICGPCSIGRGTTIVDRALIKPNTAIGPSCKIGGEVGGTIFQGFANKSHDGHLGDSWVGKWANFGAGTNNSNLLNTYSEVAMRVEPDGSRLRTGTIFLGAIVGDHAKFAINTSLMTGCCVGTGAMIATSAPPPTSIPRFAWLTDDVDRIYRLDRFIDTAEKVMARRGRVMTEAYRVRLAELHEQSLRVGK